MTTYFGTRSTLKNVFLPNQNPVDTAKQGLVFASRKLNENNQLVLPEGSTAMPSLYIPFQLGAYTSPGQALAAIKAMGFQFTQGLSFDQTYPEPDNVVTDNVTGLVTLVWNSASLGLQNLIALNPVGSVLQDNSSIISTGTIKSINVVGNQTFLSLTLVNGSAGFTTENPIEIQALLATDAPDPTTSDEVALAVYWFYKQYATAPKYTTSANIWLSVTVDGRDTSISPTATPIALVAPSAVNELGDGSINLTYDIEAYNLGLLPTQYLGNTTVTQEVDLPTDSTNFIYYANGKYIRCSADDEGLDYSTDGTNWTASNITTGTFTKAVWNGSVYVAVSAAGIYYSVNASSWTVSSQGSGSFLDVAYANTKFVAASTAGLFYSSDGITWTGCSGDDNANFISLVYGTGSDGGVWVAVTADDDAYNSTDGITFAALTVSTSGFYSANFDNGLFLLGGNGTGIVYSTDGTTFTATDLTTLNVKSIIFVDGLSKWLAATSVGIYSSVNGIAWSVTGQTTGSFVGFIVNDDFVVALSTSGLKYTTDGSTFTAATDSGATGSYTSGLYNSGLYLAGNGSGVIQSADGIAWISGSASVEGIFNGYSLTSTTCIINVVNVTGGSFNTVDAVEIVLDSSQNGGVLTGQNEISSFATLSNIKDLQTLTTTYSDFYELIGSLQNPLEASNNKFNPQGYYGYSPAMINQYPIASLTTPNVTYFKASARLDIPTAYQYPNLPVVHVMETMFNNLNNQDPFTDTSGESSVLNMNASTNQSTLPSQDILNQLTSQGWTAIGALTSGLMYVYRDVCTLQTIDGVEDQEFRFEPLQLKARWVDKNIYRVAVATATLPDGTRDNNNPELITVMTANLKQVLLVGYNAGMLGNDQNSISVTVNPNQPSRLIIDVVTSIVPTNSGSDMTEYFKSYAI